MVMPYMTANLGQLVRHQAVETKKSTKGDDRA